MVIVWLLRGKKLQVVKRQRGIKTIIRIFLLISFGYADTFFLLTRFGYTVKHVFGFRNMSHSKVTDNMPETFVQVVFYYHILSTDVVFMDLLCKKVVEMMPICYNANKLYV